MSNMVLRDASASKEAELILKIVNMPPDGQTSVCFPLIRKSWQVSADQETTLVQISDQAPHIVAGSTRVGEYEQNYF